MNKKIENSKSDIIDGLNIIIGVGYSPLEKDKYFDFDYSLKVSIKKPEINILEINTEHKILCNPEKINENMCRCLFVLVGGKDDFQNNN